jgi:N-acyl-D-aspartate/D-glutamate deacylase
MQSFLTQLPFDVLAEWKPIRSKPLEEQRILLHDPDIRARLVHAAHHGEYARPFGAEPRKPDFEATRIVYSPYLPNPSVADEARRRNVDPVELMIDVALDHDFDIFFFQQFTPQPEEDIEVVLRHPYTAMTFSDAGAHVSQILDSSIQTHLLAYWVREKQFLTLEEAIRLITSQPAKIWRLRDRGMLAPGYAADVTIFDPDAVAPLMPRVVNDLPGGSRRLVQEAHGYHATIVNGRVFMQEGAATEERAGRLLRAGQLEVPA